LLVAELKQIAGERGISAIEVKEDRLMLMRQGDYLTVGGKFPRLTKPDARRQTARNPAAIVGALIVNNASSVSSRPPTPLPSAGALNRRDERPGSWSRGFRATADWADHSLACLQIDDDSFLTTAGTPLERLEDHRPLVCRSKPGVIQQRQFVVCRVVAQYQRRPDLGRHAEVNAPDNLGISAMISALLMAENYHHALALPTTFCNARPSGPGVSVAGED
jgi:hypothetical protein